MSQLYLVLGVWGDDHGRIADSYHADNPADAEGAFLEQYTGEGSDNPGGYIIIAGVVTLVNGELGVVA